MALLLLVVVKPLSLEARLLPQRTVLENGSILLTLEEIALPMVTVNVLIKAGSLYDTAGNEGLANLTARLLTYGTRKRTALEISETLDFIGASLSASSDRELTTVGLTLLKKDLDIGLKLLAEIVTESVFPPEEVERQKQSVIASIRAKRENPRRIAGEKFLETLFPNSPYGRPTEGTEQSVKSIERDKLVKFYQRYYHPNSAILTVVGDVSHQEIVHRLGKVFQSWERGPSVEEPPLPSSPGAKNFIRINKNLTQANIIIGHEGVPRDHPDYYAIQVMNYILGGGGFSSRLMDSIRSERGLAYSVYSAFSSSKYVGTFRLVMQTKNETAQEAIRIAMDDIRRIRQKGISKGELEAAKDYLTGSFPLRLNTNRRIAGFLGQVEFFGLGLDYPERYPKLIRGISQEDVLRVAKEHLKPEKVIVVVVANQKEVKLERK